jgi:hypothetical protein
LCPHDFDPLGCLERGPSVAVLALHGGWRSRDVGSKPVNRLFQSFDRVGKRSGSEDINDPLTHPATVGRPITQEQRTNVQLWPAKTLVAGAGFEPATSGI